jgi:predicted PurR-regulated permease PerM
MPVSLPNIGEQSAQQIYQFYNTLQSSIDLQNSFESNLNTKNDELLRKQQIQINQLKEIEDKEKLLLTRSRMLQISQDRNSYKKKIIYSLIAVIFLIFILTLVMYVLYTRKIGMAKK